MSSQPWMKFYPTNWRADPALRMCSLGARGLWMEMLCVMHEADPRGFLFVNGRAVTSRQLALLVGATIAEVDEMLGELEAAGVFSRDADGAIFSRRMVREAKASAEGKANGALGGNPALKGKDAEGLTPTPTPSLVSSIYPLSEETPPSQEEASPRARDPAEPSATESGSRIEFTTAFWPEYPHKVGRPAALRAFIGARQRAPLERIMAGLRSYIREKPPDRQWLNPATFLNQDRFDDQPAAPPDPAAARPGNAHETIRRSIAREVAKRSGLDGRQGGTDGGFPHDGGPAPPTGILPGNPAIAAGVRRQ